MIFFTTLIIFLSILACKSQIQDIDEISKLRSEKLKKTAISDYIAELNTVTDKTWVLKSGVVQLEECVVHRNKLTRLLKNKFSDSGWVDSASNWHNPYIHTWIVNFTSLSEFSNKLQELKQETDQEQWSIAFKTLPCDYYDPIKDSKKVIEGLAEATGKTGWKEYREKISRKNLKYETSMYVLDSKISNDEARRLFDAIKKSIEEEPGTLYEFDAIRLQPVSVSWEYISKSFLENLKRNMDL